MKKTVIYCGLALLLAGVFAWQLTREESAPSDARKSEVISQFIHLSLAPDANNIDFLSRGRTQRTIRATRIKHIHPGVLAGFAQRAGVSEETLLARLSEPALSNAFNFTGVLFDAPQDFTTGTIGDWTWALVTQSAEDRASEEGELAECGLQVHCGVWLLTWSDETWYYAPVGAEVLNGIVEEAMPELAPIL